MSLEKVSYQKLNEEVEQVDTKIGTLSSLATTTKTDLVSAINETFTNVSNGKSLVASAITDKGVPTSIDATFQTMATNISQIETGITPTGTISINTNGTYDVTNYASANVNVSGQGPTLITKTITSNGTYNASSDNADGYSQVTVNVPVGSTNSRCFKKVFDSKITATGWIYLNEADAEIASHRNDETFVVTIMNVTDFTVIAGRTFLVTGTNHKVNSYSSAANYGALSYISSNNGGQGYGAVNKAVTTTSPAPGGNQICVTTDGKIGIYGSSTTSWEAGTYVAICGW